MQASSTLLLIKPKHFSYNAQTALTNSFQNNLLVDESVLVQAQQEFDAVVSALQANGINCLVFEDRAAIVCADAVFCNNWFSTHKDGKLFIYPMCAANRRLEIRQDILDYFHEKFKVAILIDVRKLANQNEFLEGTGSFVFDHESKLAFACLSPRTNERLVYEVCKQINYKPIFFTCVDKNDSPIYHTNVILCITSYVIVAYVEGIKNNAKKQQVLQQFSLTKKQIILLNYQQVKAFCGNMLAVTNNENKEKLVLSKTAFSAYLANEIELLSKFHELIVVDIPTIETIGGGGVRCMLGQVFLDEL